MGIEWVMIGEVPSHTSQSYRLIRKQVEELGFRTWRLPHHSIHNIPEVTLNLPGRDKKIEEYLTHIENLEKSGIYYDTYAHMANSIWRSDEVDKIRGGGVGTGLKLDGKKHTAAVFGSFTEPLSDPEGFVETYPDAGYSSMAPIVKALEEIEFDGVQV